MVAVFTQPLRRDAVYTSEPIFPLTIEQYHELIRFGKLTEADPVELLEGIPVFKMPNNAPHATSSALVRREIESRLPPGWHYRSQEPITLADGEAELDGSLVRGRIEDYATRHPGPADVALIIEIADTSIERDRGLKLRSYARAGIAEYWIVNLLERRIETFADPDSAAPQPVYHRRAFYSEASKVPLAIAGAFVSECLISTFIC